MEPGLSPQPFRCGGNRTGCATLQSLIISDPEEADALEQDSQDPGVLAIMACRGFTDFGKFVEAHVRSTEPLSEDDLVVMRKAAVLALIVKPEVDGRPTTRASAVEL